MGFTDDFKTARDATAKKSGMGVMGSRYAMAMVYLMLLVVFPLLWSVVLLASTIGVAYARWGKQKFVSKLLMIPAWALGFVAGVVTSKKKVPPSSDKPISQP